MRESAHSSWRAHCFIVLELQQLRLALPSIACWFPRPSPEELAERYGYELEEEALRFEKEAAWYDEQAAKYHMEDDDDYDWNDEASFFILRRIGLISREF